MSRPDYRLNNNPTLLTATIVGTGELIPRSGDYRIVVTDISHNGFRPLVLRQDSEAGNATTGVTSKHFLGVPISGSSHFKMPVISDKGVSIYNATECAVEAQQNPVADKVLVSANYYYFSNTDSYFDTDLRIRFRLSLTSRTLTKEELATKNVAITLTKADTSQVVLSQTGLGELERTFYEPDFDLSPSNDAGIPVEITSNIDMSAVYFRGNNLPVDGIAPYPNDEPNGSLRYVIEGESFATSRQYLSTLQLYKDSLQEGITYESREIFVDVTVVVDN